MTTPTFVLLLAAAVTPMPQLSPVPPMEPLPSAATQRPLPRGGSTAYVVPPLVAHAWEAAQEDGKHATAMENVVKTFTVPDDASIVVSNLVGDITVKAGQGSVVKIEAVKRAWGRDDADSKRQLEQTRIEIEQHAGRVEIRTVPGGPKNRIAVDFLIMAPPGSSLDLRSMVGDVKVAGIKGEVRVETVSGSIDASGLRQPASLKAVSGDVVVWSSTLDGELTANSVSGNVVLKSFKARVVNAGTVSGMVKIAEGWCERALVRSVNGDVEIWGMLAPGGHYELKSHAGDIRVHVDGKIGFELDANSFNGEINSDLDLVNQVRNQGEGEGVRSRSLRGTYGDGSAQIDVSSFNGDVKVVKMKSK